MMRLRQTLIVSVLEGAFAELVAACATGGATTAWALYLGLSPFLVGMLGALPVVALFVQPPSVALSRRVGTRTLALWSLGLARQCVLPLAFLPFVRMGMHARQIVFVACTLMGGALGATGNNAWTAWMSEFVPDALRGRYFARRAAACALASAASSLATGLALEGGAKTGHAGAVLAGLALIASASGLITTVLLCRQRAPQIAATAPEPEGAKHPGALRLLVFQAAWSAATGLAAAFYPLHMVGTLRMGFAAVAFYGAGVAMFRMATAPAWAWLVDRTGARNALIVSAFGLCVSPLLWLLCAPGHLWPLALDAALCGAAGAGLAQAMVHLPLAIARPRERPSLLAAISSAAGVAAGLASAAGGAVVKALPAAWTLFGRPLVAFQGLFLIGGAARVLAALLGLRIDDPACDAG